MTNSEHYNQNTELALLRRDLRSVGRQVDDLHRVVIRGDGNRASHVVRLDRLEQSEQRRKWALRGLWAAVTAALSGLFTQWFTR